LEVISVDYSHQPDAPAREKITDIRLQIGVMGNVGRRSPSLARWRVGLVCNRNRESAA
jgi:hypothetical protein